MRLIDADALINFLDETVPDEEMLVSQYNADWIYSFIECAPTIEAVEVVRCKDCKKGEPMVNGCVVCTRRAYKSRGLMFGGTQMLPDDYCSYGEPNCGADMRGEEDGD